MAAQTFDALFTGADPDALSYRAAVDAGNATVAASLASKLGERFPGIVLPTWFATPAGPVVTGPVVTGTDELFA